MDDTSPLNFDSPSKQAGHDGVFLKPLTFDDQSVDDDQGVENPPKQTQAFDQALAHKLLAEIQRRVQTLTDMLENEHRESPPNLIQSPKSAQSDTTSSDATIIGTFTGERMLGQDGSTYPVPANYASKSKLVEGDKLKLTILANGRFLYKQIGPTQRKYVTGELFYDSDEAVWYVCTSETRLKVLTASVTFYKGLPGHQVVVIIPEEGTATWGAVDNILKT